VKRYRVASTQIEDIHTGAMFAPGETAVGFDPADPYDAAKLADGKFVAIAEPIGEQVDATPDAIERAAELEVDLEKVAGSGKNNRILVGDVEKAHENQEAS
jgi:pyruvate/2-oxoglutarate dehydrogenase complex dihydrolipoamide acyltransferase (E2) component